jgi:hypothetical protein
VFALLLPTKFSPVPILIATVLKLYPVFLLGILLIKRQFILFLIALVFALAIFGYMWDQLPLIGVSQKQDFNYSFNYGLPIIALRLSAEKLPSWLMAGVIIAICVVILTIARYFRKTEGYKQPEGFAFGLFLAGASIYTGTFIFSWNWDCRLIFLIFCVPFVETRRFPLGGVLVILIIIAMNDLILTPRLGTPGLAIVSVAKLVVFAVLSAYLAAFVPTIFSVPRNV